jgi:hydrogenase maturation protease
MPRTLVIGYGNVHRADDGVALHVVNALRQRLGQEALIEDQTGLEALGAETDSVLLTQLVPELTETLISYDQLIFVDAHVRDDVPDLHCEPVLAEYAPSAFTHHMTPAMLLALLKAIHGLQPAGYLVSARGRDFDFHQRLSAETEALVEPAVELILQMITPPEQSGRQERAEQSHCHILETGG